MVLVAAVNSILLRFQRTRRPATGEREGSAGGRRTQIDDRGAAADVTPVITTLKSYDTRKVLSRGKEI